MQIQTKRKIISGIILSMVSLLLIAWVIYDCVQDMDAPPTVTRLGLCIGVATIEITTVFLLGRYMDKPIICQNKKK
jgi:hypothetical protein